MHSCKHVSKIHTAHECVVDLNNGWLMDLFVYVSLFIPPSNFQLRFQPNKVWGRYNPLIVIPGYHTILAHWIIEHFASTCKSNDVGK